MSRMTPGSTKAAIPSWEAEPSTRARRKETAAAARRTWSVEWQKVRKRETGA